jgi:hypothetical protein
LPPLRSAKHAAAKNFSGGRTYPEVASATVA